MPFSRHLVFTQTVLAAIDQVIPGSADTLFVHLPLKEQIEDTHSVRKSIYRRLKDAMPGMAVSWEDVDLSKSLHQWACALVEKKNTHKKMNVCLYDNIKSNS
jgi:hypothetical protein